MKLDSTFFIVICFSLLFSFCGCSEFNEQPGEADTAWKPIEIGACRAHLGVSGVTRAAGLTEIKTGALGLYRKATNGYAALSNVRYTYKAATDDAAARWESDDASKAIYVNAATADVYGIFPYMDINGAPTNGHSFDGTYVTGMRQQRYYSDSRNEVMISGSSPANNRAPRLELVMRHIYSRLTLNITNATNEKLIFKSVTLKPKAAYTTEARLDVTSTELIPAKTNTSKTGYDFPFEADEEVCVGGMAPGTVDESIEMLWIPQTFAKDIEIIIVVDAVGEYSEIMAENIQITGVIPATDLPKLDSGTRYTLPLKITWSGITLPADIVITDFATDNTGISSDPIERKKGIQVPVGDINLGGATCTAADKIALSRLIWAGGNLKSTGDSDYVWTTESDYGYYYTWNSTYTGNTSMNDTDPCSKLNAATYGTGWRMPSKDEMDKLSRCTDKTVTNGGMWFMNSSSGLFLPAAGYRDNSVGSGTTATNSAGTDGRYWSSDASSSSGGYRLYFSSGDAGVNGGNMAYGFSVRCVKSEIGIQVPADQINLGGSACTAEDKAALSKLTWAEGNLKSEGNSDYVWTTESDYGYYYTWYSTYTGDTTMNNTDPCSKLNAATYGSGWRTPSRNELTKLSHCTDKTLTNGGMWFMNSSTGLFLPAAGYRSYSVGSGTTATDNAGAAGYYWSSDAFSSSSGYILDFDSDAYVYRYDTAYGFTVRCVKGEKQ